MSRVVLRYWAGAKAVAGLSEEEVEAGSVADALRLARQRRSDPAFDAVLAASSVLRDGQVVSATDQEAPLPTDAPGGTVTGTASRGSEASADGPEPVVIEILPPFAGGQW